MTRPTNNLGWLFTILYPTHAYGIIFKSSTVRTHKYGQPYSRIFSPRKSHEKVVGCVPFFRIYIAVAVWMDQYARRLQRLQFSQALRFLLSSASRCKHVYLRSTIKCCSSLSKKNKNKTVLCCVFLYFASLTHRLTFPKSSRKEAWA